MYFKKYLNIKITLIILSIILLIFARYNGNYHSDYKYIWLFLNGNFENDIYENNSVLTGTTIIFILFNFFNLNLDNDILGFSVHVSLSIFAGIYLYKILKKIIPYLSHQELLYLIFSLGVLDSMIVNTAKSSWIGHHTMVPSHFGLSFFFFYIWNVLNNNKNTLSVLTLFFILISPRTAWFPCALAFFYFLLPGYKFKNILWSIPSIILGLVYIYFNLDFQDFETKKILFERAINKEQEEIVFHLQPIAFIILMFLSYVFYFYSLKFLKEEFKKIFKIILYLTIVVFIFGLIYGLYGQTFYPDPKIISLSPVRAMYVYQFFFVVIYFVVIKNKFQDVILRYSFYIFPFLFCMGIKGKILLIAMLLMIGIYKLNPINKLLKSIKFDFSYIFIFLIFFISINSSKNRIEKMDSYTFNKISHWSTHMGSENNDFKEFFLKLRECEDFLVYDNIKYSTTANFFSSKSKYFSKTNLNVAFNKNLYDEHFRRDAILKEIKSNHAKDLKKLKSENFLYVSNKNEEINKNIYHIKKTFGNLIFFFNDAELLKLKKKCKLIF